MASVRNVESLNVPDVKCLNELVCIDLMPNGHFTVLQKLIGLLRDIFLKKRISPLFKNFFFKSVAFLKFYDDQILMVDIQKSKGYLLSWGSESISVSFM